MLSCWIYFHGCWTTSHQGGKKSAPGSNQLQWLEWSIYKVKFNVAHSCDTGNRFLLCSPASRIDSKLKDLFWTSILPLNYDKETQVLRIMITYLTGIFKTLSSWIMKTSNKHYQCFYFKNFKDNQWFTGNEEETNLMVL